MNAFRRTGFQPVLATRTAASDRLEACPTTPAEQSFDLDWHASCNCRVGKDGLIRISKGGWSWLLFARYRIKSASKDSIVILPVGLPKSRLETVMAEFRSAPKSRTMSAVGPRRLSVKTTRFPFESALGTSSSACPNVSLTAPSMGLSRGTCQRSLCAPPTLLRTNSERPSAFHATS